MVLEALPDGLVEQASMMQQRAQAAQEANKMDQLLNAQLGAMGISPGSSTISPFAFDLG